MSAPLYRQMTDLVWVSAMPDGLAKTKGVLLCYCQHFNDRKGISNPGIARVARMCGIGERTAQMHVRALERAGILLPSRQRTGLTTSYTIHLSSLQPLFPLTPTPADFAAPPAESSTLPPQFSTLPPAETAPKQSLTAKSTDRTAAPASPVALPSIDGVSPKILADFAAIRAEKFGRGGKGKVTEQLVTEICEQAALAGLTLQQALEHCCHADKRWGSFKAGWLKPKASAPAPATPVKVWEPDTTPIPPPPSALPSPAPAARSAPAAVPTMPTGASDICIAADAPPWAARIVNKQRSGQYVNRTALNDACAVLKINPAMLRRAAAAPSTAARMH